MSEGFFTEQVGNISLHIFTASTDAAVDAWGDALSQLIENTPPDGCFRVLLDVSAKQVSFTSHARQKTKELFTRYANRKGRLAFLFSSPTAPYYSRIFFASLGRLNFERNFFSDREKALAWLRE